MAWRSTGKVQPGCLETALALALVGLTPAFAQPAADPIGDLLESPSTAQSPPPPTIPTATATRADPPPAPWAPAREQAPAIAPAPSRPDSARGEPVFIDQTDRTPDGPPTSTDRNYEARLRASFASAQGMQGPLDGSWILAAAGGADLFALQLVDKSGNPLEGAWRDVRRTGAFEGSGFVSRIERVGATLVVQFQPGPNAAMVSASLTPTGDGRWTGELESGERRTPVELRRD